MAESQALTAVVTTLPELMGSGIPIQKIALFNPDGTPWPDVITPEDGAFYTLSVQLGTLQATIDALVERQDELEAELALYRTNPLKVLIGGENVPAGTPHKSVIARLATDI